MRGWLGRQVDWRISVSVAIGVTTATLMIVTGMEPRLALVALVVAIIAAAAWLAIDLGPIASPLEWTDHGRDAARAARSDHRVRSLRQRLRSPSRRRRAPVVTDTAEPVDEIGDSLVAVIEAHLADEFGLDARSDPDGAAQVLGPELTRFVGDGSARRSMTSRRRLAHTISLVEDLCARTRAS